MNKLMAIVLAKVYFIIFSLIISMSAYAKEELSNWQKPTPIFKQDFDWLKLTSDEWLKGDIVSMYDEKLEFDSDNLICKLLIGVM